MNDDEEDSQVPHPAVILHGLFEGHIDQPQYWGPPRDWHEQTTDGKRQCFSQRI